MNWKEFLKPDWRRVLVFILYPPLLFLLQGLIISFTYSKIEQLNFATLIAKIIGVPIINFETLLSFSTIQQYQLNLIFSSMFFILDQVYRYFFACLIIWVYNKIKKR